MTIQTIDSETYARERALVNKATAYWEAHATYSRGGWSSMGPDLASHPDYAAVDNSMRGRVEQYEILHNPPERFVAYVQACDRQQLDATNYVACRDHTLTTWTGDKIGTCYLGSGWRVNSYIGSRMHQAYARVAGREYTGRTFGEGMAIVLRETSSSKRKRECKS